MRQTSIRTALTAVYTAGGVSALGSQMTMLALPWLVLETTGSATRAGAVFAVQVLPLALLGFVGAEVVQRLGARNTMIAGDLARAPIVALVPVLHALGTLSLPALLAIVAAQGICGVPYFASQRVVAAELVGTDTGALTRANSVLEGIFNATSFAGPALAGTLIAVIGSAPVIWLDATSFAISGLLLLLFVPRVSARGASPTRGPRGVWAGLHRLRQDAFLRQVVPSTVAYGFLMRVLAIALPLLAFDRFAGDARLGGLLVAGSGAGALVGSLLTYLVATRVGTERLMALAVVLLALPLWALVLPAPVVVLAGAAAVTSAAVPLTNAPYFTILTARVPVEYRPRVLQSVITLSNIAGPLGFLAAGVLTDSVGITTTMMLVAALATLATVNILLAMRHLTERSVSATVPAPATGAAE